MFGNPKHPLSSPLLQYTIYCCHRCIVLPNIATIKHSTTITSIEYALPKSSLLKLSITVATLSPSSPPLDTFYHHYCCLEPFYYYPTPPLLGSTRHLKILTINSKISFSIFPLLPLQTKQ